MIATFCHHTDARGCSVDPVHSSQVLIAHLLSQHIGKAVQSVVADRVDGP